MIGVDDMKRNAYFQLMHESDGMYLQSFPPEDGGKDLDIEDVFWYLDSKRFFDVSTTDIDNFVKEAQTNGITRLKLSEDSDMLPENETVNIIFDKSLLLAKIRMYPPSNKGERLSIENIYERIEQFGVCNGIVDKNIKLMWHAKMYCTDILLAKAIPPVQGKNARIEYHFDVDKTTKPTLLEDGSVDFYHLDMFETVEEGQLLATLVPEEEGKSGVNVKGEPILPAKVNKGVLRYGKNIRISEDELNIYSMVSGNVSLVEGRVFVSDCYEVPADVGPSTGDIEYSGNVNVAGNVISGYTIKAEGDIVVNGSVEGATLIAGGKIILKRGIQGMNKGEMTAGGDIISNYIESSRVHAGGRVLTDAIMHSDVDAQGEIVVNGKRGLIAGGSVRSTLEIEAKVIGSNMGTQTEVEVGMDPNLVDRYTTIESDMEQLASERDIHIQNIDVLKKRLKMTGKLDDDKVKKMKDSASRLKEISELMDSLTEEYEKLEEEIENCSGKGKIIVYDTAYTGVKITVSSISMFLRTNTQYSAFVREGADIRTRAI